MKAKDADIKTVSIDQLIPDDKNFNKGTEFGSHLMDESLRKFGLGRSILIDKNNRIIAGNKTAEKAGELGFDKVVVVETDGNTLVAVKRKDVDLDSQKGRELALADNATGKANLAWDEEVIAQCVEQFDFDPEDWGVAMREIEDGLDSSTGGKESETKRLSELAFTGMYYEPKIIPSLQLQDCYDVEKFNAKLRVIEESSLSEEQKSAMRMFAYRFIKINFEAAANYYSFNATEEEKAVMERLRMVLVDGSIDGFIEDDLIRVREEVMSTDLGWQTDKVSGYDYED